MLKHIFCFYKKIQKKQLAKKTTFLQKSLTSVKLDINYIQRKINYKRANFAL
jgi:hypothetical protein